MASDGIWASRPALARDPLCGHGARATQRARAPAAGPRGPGYTRGPVAAGLRALHLVKPWG